MACALLAGGAYGLGSAGANSLVPASATAASGRLYFTTYRPATVDVAAFVYRSGTLRILARRVLARVAGADGVVFSPDGRLLVGGDDSGTVLMVDPVSGSSSSIRAGVPQAMHLTLSPDGRTVYTSGEPGPAAAIPLAPLADGRRLPLRGATGVVTALAFGPHGQVLYTRSPPGGRGSVGLIDLRTGATHVLLRDIAAAHGIVFDPWSRSYIVVGGDEAIQLPAADPSHVESELMVPGVRFDQAAVTGRGQVLMASNLGQLVLVDYSRTGRIGDVADHVVQRHLAVNLDDVAPLVGPGARPIPTSAHLRRLAGGSALALGGLLGTSVALGARLRSTRARRSRVRAKTRSLPRWDRRRRQLSAGSGLH